MITSPSYFNIRHLAKYKYIFLKCLEKSKANIIPRRIYTRYFINGKAMNVCVCVCLDTWIKVNIQPFLLL